MKYLDQDMNELLPLEVIDKPTKKKKGGQKLTWHHTITRDLKTIELGTRKQSKSFLKY